MIKWWFYLTKKDKIFIQIASYRDPQLVPTIEDMINKAKISKNFKVTFDSNEYNDIDKIIRHFENKGFDIGKLFLNFLKNIKEDDEKYKF